MHIYALSERSVSRTAAIFGAQALANISNMKLGCNEIIKLGAILALAKPHADGSLFCLADDRAGLEKVTPLVIQEHVEVLSSIFSVFPRCRPNLSGLTFAIRQYREVAGLPRNHGYDIDQSVVLGMLWRYVWSSYGVSPS